MATSKKKAPAAPATPDQFKADEFGRVFMEPGTARGTRFLFDMGAIAAFESATEMSVLTLIDRAGQGKIPLVAHVLELIRAGALVPEEDPAPTAEVILKRHGFLPLYMAALAALAWGVEDLGLLATTDAETEPEAESGKPPVGKETPETPA